MTNLNGQSNHHSQRNRVQYQDLCDTFRIQIKPFTSQYYPYYLARLEAVRPLIHKSIEAKWSDTAKVIKISEFSDHANEKVIIIGVLFKQMKNQPTILKEIAYEENQDSSPLTPQDDYTDENDHLLLQNENECVKLHGNISVHSHVTGVVIGLLGYADSEGNEFTVEDYCYPLLPDPWSRSSIAVNNTNNCNDKYILLVSGLGFSRNLSSKLKNALDMLSNYLVGLLDPDDGNRSANIIRLIIAGNLIGESVRTEEEAKDESLSKPWLRKGKPYTVDIMSTIDEYLAELGRSIEIEIMPGFTDVTNVSIPQQPIHPSILPRSSIYSTIRGVTNPYAASFDSRLFIGNSGQTIDNIRRFSNLKDPIEIMKKTISWCHLAPTAPDTLHSYPCKDNDPFCLTKLPDVYFTGNQDKFATEIQEFGSSKIRFISLPKFEKSFTGALVNLNDLSCDCISFSTS
ncbi:DNA polymerase delta subunit 2 [Tetranychus urticae]|uniref:DNA polymerase delta small subunit n=1 Tax=Tetranychus urticae TaxID=32264 RepID=T1KDS3_TETUR|nr:DNA polymerase delta subunit 2 [Tetranychus urticae]